MEKMENSHDSSVIYDEVSRCVIYFSDGEKKVIVNQQTDSLLAVKVVTHPNESSSFTELVYKNYNQSHSVEELAEVCGYNSVKTFTRHFKKNFKTTPKQWMLSIRKDKMLVYIKNTKYTFIEISKILGFANVAHMSDFCLKKTGKRPEEIRNSKL